MKRTLLSLLFSLLVSPAFAQFVAPVGLPAPQFGVTQVKPAATTPTSTMPTTLAAGQVVTLTGGVTGRAVECAGTAENPGWLLGTTTLQITGETTLNGWCIADGLTFIGSHSVHLRGRAVLRNSESTGVATEGPSAAVTLTDQATAYNNRVHDHGNLGAAFDQDAHGITVGRGALGVWIIGNRTYRNSGDGINCNPYPYDQSGLTAIRYVFVGGNKSYDNKQTGIWCKQSQDVLVIGNEVWGHREGNSSYGQGIGYQYSTNLVWYLGNIVHDNGVGFGVSEAYADGTGPLNAAFFIGNTIVRANGTSCSPNPGDPLWTCAAIRLTGDAYSYVVNNRIQDSIGGIHVMRGKGIYIAGNVGTTNIVVAGPGDGGNTPPTPAIDFVALYQALYGLDISSYLASPPPVADIPVPPVTGPPVPPTPPDTRPLCSSIPIPIRWLYQALRACR